MRRAAGVALVLALAGCGGSSTPARIQVSSPAIAPGGRIPRTFTCDGLNVSPPLRWSKVPGQAQDLTLVMRDPDAHNFIHWRLTGIRPQTRAIAPGQAPPGATAGRNGFGKLGYGGPCPPRGTTHRYVIEVSAQAGGKVLAAGKLTGTYTRR